MKVESLRTLLIEEENKMNEREYSILLKNAVTDYAVKKDKTTVSDWLTAFLTEKRTDKTPEQIANSVSTIVSTLDTINALREEMHAKLKAGQAPENWFANKIISQEQNKDYIARQAAHIRKGLNKAFEELGEANKQVIDIITENELNDGNWNDYRIKDILKETAIAAGNTTLASLVDDKLPIVTESVLSEIAEVNPVIEKLILEADKGLKAVISGVSLAAEKYVHSILPFVTDEDVAALGDTYLETLSSFAKVVKGEYSIVDALTNIKNTAVVGITNAWNSHKEQLQEAVHTFFGEGAKNLKTTVISTLGSVVKGDIKISDVVKKAVPAAKSFIKENAGKLVEKGIAFGKKILHL